MLAQSQAPPIPRGHCGTVRAHGVADLLPAHQHGRAAARTFQVRASGRENGPARLPGPNDPGGSTVAVMRLVAGPPNSSAPSGLLTCRRPGISGWPEATLVGVRALKNLDRRAGMAVVSSP